MSSGSAVLDLQERAAALRRRPLPYPWLFCPPSGQHFMEDAAIVTPAAAGVETVVVSYQVQEGYAAVLVGLVNLYSGTGYTQGTATLLTWKLRLDQTEDVQFYENILMDHGNLATPWPVPGGIRLKSGQLLELRVTVPVGSTIGVGGTNRNIGVLMGWEWPAAAGEDF